METAVAAPVWRDGKRYLWLMGLAVPLQVLVAWGLVTATGQGVFWWWGAMFVFVVMPVLDQAIGLDATNPPEELVTALEEDRWYRWATFLFLPLQYAALVWACWVLSTWDLGLAEKAGLATTIGLLGGVAINTAHELGHKRDTVERWLSKLALAQTAYGHFYVEHNRGHHVRVATPEDPASSRLGESFWAFWPRTVVGSLRSAWGLESKQWAKAGRSRWNPRNDVLNAWAMTAVLYAGLVAVLGVDLLPWLALQAVLGFSLLEVVNYLEHYGLLRQKSGERYERVQPRHSWNANNTASNVLLYHLQRHSDHHANPMRRYQSLRHMPEAPQLPTGYAGMIVLALVPALWRRVMDPRVLAHYDGDVTLANLHPRARERYLRRYPAPARQEVAA